MTVRTRFAPSPTGYLHVGGVRTALFNWLYAKRHHGEYLLRIEDTDRERSSTEYTQDIFSGLSWLGVDSDLEPVFQSSRMKRYGEVIHQLLDEKRAYHCYCSRERLDALRREQMKNKQKPRYDGFCRSRASIQPAGSKPVVRFKNPIEGCVMVEDRVHGMIEVENSELDDLIIARSDGSPTFHLCVVVDDIDYAITHVIRGDDHLSNTSRQINIFRALDKSVPSYAHIPLIHGQDGKRLSKRHAAVAVHQYKKDGFLAQALVNYLVRLGWSHGNQEIFSREEMIEFFDLSSIQSSPAVFDMQKLLWVNHQYLKHTTGMEIRDELAGYFHSKNLVPDGQPDLSALFDVQKERNKTLLDIYNASDYFYKNMIDYDETLTKKHFAREGIKTLQILRDRLTQLDTWSAEGINAVIQLVCEDLGMKFGQVAPPLRLAVTGRAKSPPIGITLELLGAEKSLQRIHQAIEHTGYTL